MSVDRTFVCVTNFSRFSKVIVMSPIAFFIHLLALSNPIGALPVFLSATSDMSPTTKQKVAILTGLSVALFTLLFLLSTWFEAYLSPMLLSVLSRVIGLVMMSIAVSMLVGGLKSSFLW